MAFSANFATMLYNSSRNDIAELLAFILRDTTHRHVLREDDLKTIITMKDDQIALLQAQLKEQCKIVKAQASHIATQNLDLCLYQDTIGMLVPQHDRSAFNANKAYR